MSQTATDTDIDWSDCFEINRNENLKGIRITMTREKEIILPYIHFSAATLREKGTISIQFTSAIVSICYNDSFPHEYLLEDLQQQRASRIRNNPSRNFEVQVQLIESEGQVVPL